MRRREWLAVLIGGLGGGVLSFAVSWCFVGQSGLWLSVLVGSVLGLAGGAFGQNFIEGLVVAGVCLALLVAVLLSPIPSVWLRELATGFCVGTAAGWIARGTVARGPSG